MPKYAAFLRGIMPTNPAMRNENLRGVLEGLGLTGVQAIISSGNLIFESPETDASVLEEMIEVEWPKQLGFKSTTIIRNLEDLRRLVTANPFPGLEHGPGSYLTVTFLKRPATPAVQLESKGCAIAASYDREICSVIDTTLAGTPDFMAKAEKAYGKEITTRTWKTIGRIVAKMEAK